MFILGILSTIIDNVFHTTINYGASGIFGASISGVGWIGTIVGLALLIPSICVSVRRLHDTDRSGWWWWISIICCIGSLILLVFYLQPSTPGPNRFGPDPSGGAI